MQAGKDFLAENAKKPDVVTTASGLQYKVIQQGDGPRPDGPNAEVEVHYHGRLIDGTVFDSSYDRGESISFFLNQVIPGWTEGVQLMPVGSKYEFYIPHELAYGTKGAGSIIPPYATLIFEVELLKTY
jgi:FKBP-type peptidyl-prolyl cis-trans isomerase